MPTEVKSNSMQYNVNDYAKKIGVPEQILLDALAESDVQVTDGQFECDSDTLEFVTELAKENAPEDGNTVHLQPGRTPRDLANAFGVTEKEVQMTLIKKFKTMATLTTVLGDDLVENLGSEFGKTVKWGAPEAPKKSTAKIGVAKKGGGAVLRSPVVTIMGHVDHGKTSLLDYIRKANVVSKEHGGITQHIGAYQVNLPEGTITFLDTPGHAAFTAMRARGAQVTDIAILVVAADDGIMPQTKEAISHAKNAGVPIIVAINKIDKAGANVDKVLMALPQHELVPEAYGGDIITVPVSAHTGEGVPQLLEMILLQAEILELKADPDGDFKGVVVEAQLEKGRGPVATVLVEEGTLKVGDIVTVGDTWGKIKAMSDFAGARVKSATPSQPVEILGLNDVPGAGDPVYAAKDEREARDYADAVADKAKAKLNSGPKKKLSLRDLKKHLEATEVKDLNLIIKADVQGSVEAVRGLIEKIENEEITVKVLHSGVGSITESDILLASTADAICVGFNVKPEIKARQEADRQKIEIRTYTIIYELIEDIEKAVIGMLEPKFEEEYHGTVEVRAVFKLTKAGKVAGSHITDGKVLRNDKVRVKRGGELVYEGNIESLRNVKQDVREMTAGQDCGLRFVNWDEFKEGDIVEAYDMIQID